jgi:hypothetical protein
MWQWEIAVVIPDVQNSFVIVKMKLPPVITEV